jgi:uncharacterized coiled-coil protein SlyX
MVESENNGVHQNDDTNGNGAEASKAAKKKRVLTKDLSAQVAELEKKVAGLSDQIAKLDERMMKIAHAVAQTNLMRGSLA